MLAATNDVFFAPSGEGIPLYLDNGTPITADVTSQVYLWDAGTELNEEPFIGPNTVTNQGTVNTGVVDTNTKVGAKITTVTEGFVYAYPAVASLIKVTVTHTTGTLFDITIDNLAGAALTTGDLVSHPTPLSPGVWVVSSAANALFTDQTPAPAHGLEALAEDGKARNSEHVPSRERGITYPASPGAWLLHKTGTKPLLHLGCERPGRGPRSHRRRRPTRAARHQPRIPGRLSHGRRIQHARRCDDAWPDLARLEVPIHVRRKPR